MFFFSFFSFFFYPMDCQDDRFTQHVGLAFYEVDHTVRRKANQVRGRAAIVFP